jgi:hypothetical protein
MVSHACCTSADASVGQAAAQNRSTLLEGDADSRPVYEHERGVQVGIGCDRLEISGVDRGPPHVVRHDQTSGADERQPLGEVIGVACKVGVDLDKVDRLLALLQLASVYLEFGLIDLIVGQLLRDRAPREAGEVGRPADVPTAFLESTS